LALKIEETPELQEGSRYKNLTRSTGGSGSRLNSKRETQDGKRFFLLPGFSFILIANKPRSFSTTKNRRQGGPPSAMSETIRSTNGANVVYGGTQSFSGKVYFG